MIKDIKLGITMMRNGLNYDGAMGGVLLVVVFSLLYIFFFPVPLVSGLFIAVGVLGVVQQIYTVTISGLVQTSPFKKKLRTIIPAYIAGIALLIGNTLCIGMHWIAYLRMKDNASIIYTYLYGYDPKMYANSLVICALFMVFFLIYCTWSNVFFWASTVLFLGGWVWIRFFHGDFELAFWDITIETAVVLSYVVVLIGSIVLYGINCLLYKFEYSEWSFRGLMKRASK